MMASTSGLQRKRAKRLDKGNCCSAADALEEISIAGEEGEEEISNRPSNSNNDNRIMEKKKNPEEITFLERVRSRLLSGEVEEMDREASNRPYRGSSNNKSDNRTAERKMKPEIKVEECSRKRLLSGEVEEMDREASNRPSRGSSNNNNDNRTTERKIKPEIEVEERSRNRLLSEEVETDRAGGPHGRTSTPFYSTELPTNVYRNRLPPIWCGRRPFVDTDEESSDSDSNDIDGSCEVIDVIEAMDHQAADASASFPTSSTKSVECAIKKLEDRLKAARSSNNRRSHDEVDEETARKRTRLQSDVGERSDELSIDFTTTSYHVSSIPPGLVKNCSVLLDRIPDDDEERLLHSPADRKPQQLVQQEPGAVKSIFESAILKQVPREETYPKAQAAKSPRSSLLRSPLRKKQRPVAVINPARRMVNKKAAAEKPKLHSNRPPEQQVQTGRSVILSSYLRTAKDPSPYMSKESPASMTNPTSAADRAVTEKAVTLKLLSPIPKKAQAAAADSSAFLKARKDPLLHSRVNKRQPTPVVINGKVVAEKTLGSSNRAPAELQVRTVKARTDDSYKLTSGKANVRINPKTISKVQVIAPQVRRSPKSVTTKRISRWTHSKEAPLRRNGVPLSTNPKGPAPKAVTRSSITTTRIPKLPPSKCAQNATDYVSPLSLGQQQDPSPSTSQDNESPNGADTPSSPHLNLRRNAVASPARSQKWKRKDGGTISISNPEVMVGSEIVVIENPTDGSTNAVIETIVVETKSILKKVVQEAVPMSGDESRMKKMVTFSDEPQIKYIEPRKEKESRSIDSDNPVSNNNTGTGSSHFGTAAKLSVEDEIVSAILKWNPDWLREAEQMLNEHKFVEVPPIAPQWPSSAVELRKSYEKLSNYADSYKILLLHEIWEKLFLGYITGSFQDGVSLNCLVVTAVDTAQTFKDFNVVALVDIDDVPKIRENILVTFRLGDRSHHHKAEETRELVFFGLIKRAHNSYKYRRIDEVGPELKQCASVNKENVKRFCHMEISIRARSKTNMPVFEKGLMVLKTASDISSMMRLVTALAEVKDSPLQSLILTPNKIAHSPSMTSIDDLTIKTGASFAYNEAQLRIISSCISALVNNADGGQPIIRLISGTVGSGKSQAVVGLIEEALKRKQHSNQCQGIILVAAPTSESLDKLSRKILALKAFYQTSRFLKFVRLGERSTVAQDISGYCMRSLVDNNMRETEDSSNSIDDEERSDITERIAYLRAQLFTFTESQLSEEDQSRHDQIESEIEELQQRLGRNRKTHSANSRKQARNEESHRTNLIFHADVIACVLNGDERDFNLLKRLHRSGTVKVLCAIIDDAHEAGELETLVAAYSPLEKLFLFGRENGCTSAKVMSKFARDHGFGTSLFDRIVSNFQPDLSPVLQLTGQINTK